MSFKRKRPRPFQAIYRELREFSNCDHHSCDLCFNLFGSPTEGANIREVQRLFIDIPCKDGEVVEPAVSFVPLSERLKIIRNEQEASTKKERNNNNELVMSPYSNKGKTHKKKEPTKSKVECAIKGGARCTYPKLNTAKNKVTKVSNGTTKKKKIVNTAISTGKKGTAKNKNLVTTSIINSTQDDDFLTDDEDIVEFVVPMQPRKTAKNVKLINAQTDLERKRGIKKKLMWVASPYLSGSDEADDEATSLEETNEKTYYMRESSKRTISKPENKNNTILSKSNKKVTASKKMDKKTSTSKKLDKKKSKKQCKRVTTSKKMTKKAEIAKKISKKTNSLVSREVDVKTVRWKVTNDGTTNSMKTGRAADLGGMDKKTVCPRDSNKKTASYLKTKKKGIRRSQRQLNMANVLKENVAKKSKEELADGGIKLKKRRLL